MIDPTTNGGAASKGAGLITGQAVWRKLLTPEEFRRLYIAMSPEGRALIDKPPLAVAWVPFAHGAELAEAAARVFGERGLHLVEAQGAAILEHDLKGMYRALLRVVSIDFAIGRAAKMYSTYVQNGGSLTAERLGPKALIAHYRDLPSVSDAQAWFLGGCVLGVLRLVGAKKPAIRDRTVSGHNLDLHVAWD